MKKPLQNNKSSSSNTDPSPLDHVTRLLGADVFFVPCKHGTKEPLVKYADVPFENTQTEVYRARFALKPTNIAVYLGKASGGLCAIDFDSDADLKAFLALNPKLTETTQSRGSRGGMIWIRVTGEYPESCSPKDRHFEWRADRRLSTIHGRHPKGMDYRFVVEQPPLTLEFAEIQWPEEWQQPWKAAAVSDALTAEYGQPFYLTKTGMVSGVNERYWAALYARENRVFFDPDVGGFYHYDHGTGLWQPITQARIREAISARILKASRESGHSSLELQIKQARVTAIVSMLQGLVEKSGAFQRKAPFIHVANGVIRLVGDDVQFTGFSPDDFSRNRSPIHFDEKAECPRFLDEFICAAVNSEDADLLQRWAGLALFGYNSPQRLLILDGTANGGKGTFVRIIQALVGPENCQQLRTSCLDTRFETYRFHGKTLLIGPDVPGDFLMRKGASMIKMLVGGDPISAEGKGLNGDFQMFGTFNIVMTCNSRLRIRLEDDAGAWRRRLLVVRYEKAPPARRILDFQETLLREEGSGILRWALAGFVKLQAEFRELGDFALTSSQRCRIDSLLSESDSLRRFIEDAIDRDPRGDITINELQQAYAEYCAGRSWSSLPTTVVERTAGDLMLDSWQVPKSHGVQRDGRCQRGWKKVRLKNGPSAGGNEWLLN